VKFKIKHFKNLLIRIFTFDKYYVCEECHKIHKRDGQELRLELGPGELMSNRLWYGSVSKECLDEQQRKFRELMREHFGVPMVTFD
jgi:hypothetical protein